MGVGNHAVTFKFAFDKRKLAFYDNGHQILMTFWRISRFDRECYVIIDNYLFHTLYEVVKIFIYSLVTDYIHVGSFIPCNK